MIGSGVGTFECVAACVSVCCSVLQYVLQCVAVKPCIGGGGEV